MLETKGQKQNFFTAIVLIVILSLVTLWSRSSFKYKDNTDYSKGGLSSAEAAAYLKYLQDIKIDTAASKELFEQLRTQS